MAERRTFVVTGATGYIGSKVANALVELGDEVHLVHRPSSDLSRLAAARELVVFWIHEGTPAVFDALFGEVAVDAVIHLAAISTYDCPPDRIGEIVAAFGLVQLNKLKNNIEARRRNFRAHLDFFRQYEEWFVLPREIKDAYTGWLAFPLTLRAGAPFTRRDLQIHLE